MGQKFFKIVAMFHARMTVGSNPREVQWLHRNRRQSGDQPAGKFGQQARAGRKPEVQPGQQRIAAAYANATKK